ncbi:MAG: hypothetical protein KDM91_06870 [Verrucomicrobiae bacterium]|nr:hypothetical protein [Verrucomicrobiae bacterium]
MKSKRTNILLLSVLFLIPALVAPYVSLRWREYRIINQSESIQTSLENFRQQHGRYPSSLTEVGVTETVYGNLTYQRVSEAAYQLRFLKRPDVPLTFNSTERKWH